MDMLVHVLLVQETTKLTVGIMPDASQDRGVLPGHGTSPGSVAYRKVAHAFVGGGLDKVWYNEVALAVVLSVVRLGICD